MMTKRILPLVFSALILIVPATADAIHIPNHPALGLIELNPNPLGFVTPLPSGGVVFNPFFDFVANPFGLYHWDTEIWNLGPVPATFVAGWFAPGPGYPIVLGLTLLPGGGFYAPLHVADGFFVPFPEFGPRLHAAFNFTPFFLGFDVSVTELPFPLIGTEPGVDPSEPFGFLGRCETEAGCSFGPTTAAPDFGFSASIPGPASLALLGIGLVALGAGAAGLVRAA
jgi:hypothetical protein